MNNDRVAGKFDQLKGKIKITWSKLTDDEILFYDGKQDQFFGKLEEKYGLAREAAEKRMKELEKTCATSSGTEKTRKTA